MRGRSFAVFAAQDDTRCAEHGHLEVCHSERTEETVWGGRFETRATRPTPFPRYARDDIRDARDARRPRPNVLLHRQPDVDQRESDGCDFEWCQRVIPSEARDPLRACAGDPSPSSRLRMTRGALNTAISRFVIPSVPRKRCGVVGSRRAPPGPHRSLATLGMTLEMRAMPVGHVQMFCFTASQTLISVKATAAISSGVNVSSRANRGIPFAHAREILRRLRGSG